MCDFVFVLGKLREDNTKRVKKKRTKALVDNITRGTLSVTVPTVLMCVLSHIWPLATPWTAACRLLCPWDFLGKNTGADWDFLLQGIFHNPGIEPVSPALAGRFFTTEPAGFQSYDYTETLFATYLSLLIFKSSKAFTKNDLWYFP